MEKYEAHFLKSQGVLIHFAKSDYEWNDNPEHIPEAQDDGTTTFIYFESEVGPIAAEQIAKMLYGDYCAHLLSVTG